MVLQEGVSCLKSMSCSSAVQEDEMEVERDYWQGHQLGGWENSSGTLLVV